uniref:Uncharacterized protein n=1 Tax=Thermosphaera aggregans TaxID=54254 RepID=A0A7C2FZ47_9CREN
MEQTSSSKKGLKTKHFKQPVFKKGVVKASPRLIRIYRFINAGEEEVRKDLSRIEELIKQRVLENPGVVYNVLTSISHSGADSLIIIEAGSEGDAVRESELVYNLLKASCKTLDFEIVGEESLKQAVASGLRSFFSEGNG